MRILKAMLSRRKTLAAIATLIASLVASFGYDVSGEELLPWVIIATSGIGGIAVVDHRRGRAHAAKAAAESPDESPTTPPPESVRDPLDMV